MYLPSNCLLTLFYILCVNLFSGFIYILYFYHTFIVSNWPANDLKEKTFDYIIVGCGTAGGLIANRLSQDPSTKILILEAGQPGNSLLEIPSVGILLQKTYYDWQYQTTSQNSACKALDQNVSQWPMGKIVGGTSMLNNMIYVRGHEKDFDDWFERKENYNSYSTDILPYFEKLEGYLDVPKHPESGIYVTEFPYVSVLYQFVLDAAQSLGFPITEETMDCKEGVGKPKSNLYTGRRWTSAHTLNAHSRLNVVLRTGRTVERVLLKSNFEAYGVIYRYFGQKYYARGRKGIILSAGVVGSPKILMLSGIGKKNDLEQLKIRTKVDLPVGENLQDHITTGFDLIMLNQSLDLGISQMFSPLSAFKYFLNGDGPWTTGGCEALLYVNTSNFNFQGSQSKTAIFGQPDLQLMVMPISIKEDSGLYLRRLIGISDHAWNNYFANDTPAITILPVLLHPKSRGIVKLLDKNWASKPIIDPKYLTDDYDIEVLIRGIELVKKIIKTDAMQKLGARLNDNVFPGCEDFEFNTRAYWECYVRHMSITSYHPVGTCKMGHADDISTVVNYDFQVKSTNKLYVVDGSIMPTLTSGNINGAILMLAEMASEVITKRDFFANGQCYLICLFLRSVCC